MNSSQWGLVTDDIANRTNLIDQNNRLEWITTPGWSDGDEAIRIFASEWVFDLNDDFEFNAGFHYDHTAVSDNDYGTVLTGLFYGSLSAIESSYIFAAGASSDVDYYHAPVKKFWTYMGVPGNLPEEQHWQRMNDTGVLYAQYDSLRDELRFSAEGGLVTYTGLKSGLGLTRLGVLFAGSSNGASLAVGEAYLRNFTVVEGTITPEPLSCALFIVGGSVLFAGRKFCRKT